MKKLAKSAAYPRRVRMGVYVSAQCYSARRTDLAQKVDMVVEDVKVKGRAWEDSQERTTRAAAHKKAADWDLDNCAQDIRFRMASVSRHATNEAPYTHVWHSGIDYYTGAREADEVSVYSELITLLCSHLSPEDPIRTQEVPRLQSLVEVWQTASSESTEAQTAETQARVSLDSAELNFDRVMDEVYGTLFAESGRKGADRFFP